MEAFIFFPLMTALVGVIAQVVHDTVTIKPTELPRITGVDLKLEARLDKALRTFDRPVWWAGHV
jgi:hypothetical protein